MKVDEILYLLSLHDSVLVRESETGSTLGD